MKHRFGITALGTLLLLSAAHVALAATTFRGDVALLATGIDADARGRVKLRIVGSDDGRFEVDVKRLDRSARYDVVAEGIRVGEIATNGGGSGRLRLRSNPQGPSQSFLGFDPRGATIVVRDALGRDVLAAALPTGGTPGGGGGDAICCIPDDRGPECEDRTPAECAAQGGTLTTATSCLPNPCAGTPPPAGSDVICCIPDDSGPECEDRTPAECAAQGGIAVEADSCASNPCAAIPPADPDIRCCLPDDSGTECEDRTPAECLAQGGVDLGAGSCTPNPCGDVTPPGGGSGDVRVRCERRSNRSKVSVDGENLAAGSYRARIVSGASQAESGVQPTIGDEVEFDFDSDPGDIGAGATAIAPAFLAGDPPSVLGQVLDAQGVVVAERTVTCEVK